MWEGIAGALVSAGAKIIPSLFGDTSGNKAEAQGNANFELQQRIAEHGTLMKARDVMRAYQETGIHPLALLGTGATGASPVNFHSEAAPSSWKKGIADAGQDIGRAISATAGAEDRKLVQAMTMQRMQAETDLLRARTNSENARLNQPHVGPAMPGAVNKWLVEGQGDSVNTELRSPMARGPLVVDQPMKRNVSDPGQLGQEPGAVAGIGWARMPDGSYMAVKSEDAQKRLEDDFWGNTKHFLKRTFGKYIPYPAPPGKVWRFDAVGDPYLTDLRKTSHPSQRYSTYD